MLADPLGPRVRRRVQDQHAVAEVVDAREREHLRAEHVRRGGVQLGNRAPGVVGVRERQPEPRGGAQDRARVDAADLDRDQAGAGDAEVRLEQPDRLGERRIVDPPAAERERPRLRVVEALGRDRAAVADGEQHVVVREAARAASSRCRGRAATSASSWSRSTTGSPPPEALMKLAPRRKSSTSVALVI